MKTTYLLLSAALLAGCCYHNNTSYRFQDGTTRLSNPSNSISPHITIDATRKQNRIPFLYASFVATSPYCIHLKATSRTPPDQPLIIHAVKLSSDDEVIFEKSDPIQLKAKLDKYGGFTTDRDGTRRYNHSYIYRHKLGDTLPYQRGRKVYLEITWEVPGMTQKQTHRACYQAASGPPIIHPLFLNSIMD